MLIDVALSFPTRADAVAAAARTAAATADGLLDVHAAAVVSTGPRGRTRVVHGLPLTRDQRAEHRLLGIAGVLGIPVDTGPAMLGILRGRVPHEILDTVRDLLPRHRSALALRLAGAHDTAPVLTLAELTRPHGPVGILTTTADPLDSRLLEAALVG